ncbi:MAG: UDP-N-acetylmuramoyl-L-alanine--D-glutamate ligase, partial [Candidatus Omnitrophica bacterium]|nr:UDP-N-acetylmuramoyl-L-alanine--D-glutamate ligase [Candidatus Omnitrophota bacterium]
MLHTAMDFKFKKVRVIGLGKSGLAAAQLLKNREISVEVSDCSNSQEVKERVEFLRKQGIVVEIGSHTPEFIEDKDLLVVSPGVNNNFVSLWAQKKNIPLISEIELGYSFCSRPIIAITGTNGKTSVAVLTGNLLRKAGKKVVVCGNIGIPFSQVVLDNDYEIIVLEVSSFQLEKINKFKPYISVILNITPDHLDCHKTFEQYKQAKYRIFENQSVGNWVVIDTSYKSQVTSHKLKTKKDKFPKVLYLDR